MKNKKSVFFLFLHLGLGGIQKKMVDIVNYIEETNQSIEPHLVFRTKENFSMNSKLPKNFESVHIENIFPNNNRRKSRYIFFLIYLILEYNPKVLVPFLHQAAAYSVLMKYLFFWKKIKVVTSQDNILSMENNKNYSEKIHSPFILKIVYKLADKIIVQTSFAKKDLIKNFNVDGDKIHVIRNWIKDDQKIKRLKKYDLMYCGRFSPQKNLTRLLDVLITIKKEIPKIKLCLVGNGPDKKKIIKYIKDNNLEKNVVIIPPKVKIIELMAQTKILTITSDFEGHPMILLEAMSQEVVPVSIKYPGLKEYLKNGKTGFIANSTNEMASIIVSLLKDKKQMDKIGKQARQEVIKKYNVNYIKKTLNLL